MSACIAPGCKRPRLAGRDFCAICMQAPAGRRGGWLSAYRRRLQMSESDKPLNASRVFPRLWVGGTPPFDKRLEGFTLLALCAEEIQPARLAFGGRVIRPRLDDHRPTPSEIRRAVAAGRTVGLELASGGRALVTCHMGWNRSALVAGIALLSVTRMSADHIVKMIRACRSEDALGNRHFVELLERIAARRGR